MVYVIAAPEMVTAAATDLGDIGSTINAARASAATHTAGVLAAAEDEVSAAIAVLFSAHGQDFQAIGAKAAAFHAQFVKALNSSGESYAGAEATNLAALKDTLFGSPVTPPIPASRHPTFTGTPSLLTKFEDAVLLRPVKAFLNLPVIDKQLVVPGSPLDRLLVSGHLAPLVGNSPPKLLPLLLRETVQPTTFDGMSVVQITPAHPDDNYVIALYGSGFFLPANVFHWLEYTVMAQQTGATIEVPIYPLIQQGGTAGVVVPKMAGFFSAEIAAHGASHVSVLGDSAGGTIALATVEYMVANDETVPASMVLVSPATDPSFTNPNIAFVRDPWLYPVTVVQPPITELWAGSLAMNNPLVSPLYGSLQGIPATYVYSGALDPVAPDLLILQQEAVSQGAPISFELANGGIHDWILLTPDGFRYWPQIYQELGA